VIPAEMEQRLLALIDRAVAAREPKARAWTCGRCGTTNTPKTGACARCGSPGAPRDAEAVAEYRALHARWMMAREGQG
jgi:uncharacterized OB-fold protein